MNADAPASPTGDRRDDAAGAARRAAGEVVARLQAAGHTAYWAGGCVRDMLLRRTPKDYDVATDATPDQVCHVFPGADLVGKAFGVVIVAYAGSNIDVATFRRDSDYSDGRHPRGVAFADARSDAQRRDFTINAMFWDPVAQRLFDWTGGQADLDAGMIRCVGSPRRRFAEDHLRMLRAVRFAGALDFALEAETRDAIREQATAIQRISAERVRDELTRILTESVRPGEALRLLSELGLLSPILPEVTAMIGQAQPPRFHPEGDVFEHTVAMLNMMSRPSPRLAWSVLLHDVGKPPTAHEAEDRLRFNGHAAVGARMAETILRRLRFSNSDIAAICSIVGGHMRFMDVKDMRPSTLRRFIGAETFETELELHRLDCLSSHGKLDNFDRLVAFRESVADETPLPARWVDGHDIMRLGVPKGRHVGQWLKHAYDAQLEGRFADRQALLNWLRTRLADAGTDPLPDE